MPDSRERHARTALRLLTFGGLSLVDSSGAAVGQQRRRLALLALLSTAPEQGLSRDRLVSLLSPESPTDSARHALQQLIYYLRQQAGADLFVGSDPLRLNPAVVSSDVSDFEGALEHGDLSRATALYRGPFLEGFHVDSAEFEDWAAGERSRLAARYSDALFRMAQASQSAGDHAAAIGWWRRLANLDPLSARTALGVMQSLVSGGDIPGALRHARVHAAIVHTELGNGPDPEIAAFAARLEAAQPNAVAVERAPLPASTSLSAEQSAAAGDPRASPPRTKRNARFILASGLGVAVLAGALMSFRAVRDARGHDPVYPRNAIAVLPFQNRSVEPSLAYFAGGLHDELLTQLSKVAGLTLKSGESAIAYTDTNTTLRQVARETGAGSMVVASVQVVGTRLRVNVRLIDANTGVNLWADHYDRTVDDAFAIQSEVARQIVAAVDVALSGSETRALAEAHTTSAEAYRLYLQGRDYFNRPFQPLRDVEIAQKFYEQAIAIDPGFALAHVALSQLHGYRYITRLDHSPARAARQREEAEAALRLDPNLPEAHLALGTWYYQSRGDYPRALAELHIARAGLPNDPDVISRIGQVTRRMGNWTESIAAHEQTTQLSPRSAERFKELGVTYWRVRRYADAVKAFDRASILAPENAFPRLLKADLYVRWKGQLDTLRAVFRGKEWDLDLDASASSRLALLYWDRKVDSMLAISKMAHGGVFQGQVLFLPASLYAAWAHQLRGDRAAARAAFDSALAFVDSTIKDHADDERVHAARGLALAGLGKREEALDEARWLQQSTPYRNDKFQGREVAANRARILAQVGDADGALDEIESLLANPSEFSVHLLRLDPGWDPIRTHTRFAALVTQYVPR